MNKGSWALAAALLLSPAAFGPGALAQAVMPPTQGPAAANPSPTPQAPHPQTPTPQAVDLESYFGMLQTAEQRLRDELARVEAGARPTQTGAMSPDAIQLHQAVLAARDAIGRAPENFQNNPVQQEAQRHARANSSVVNRGRMEQSEIVQAGQETRQWLERLRAEVGKAVPRRPS